MRNVDRYKMTEEKMEYQQYLLGVQIGRTARHTKATMEELARQKKQQDEKRRLMEYHMLYLYGAYENEDEIEAVSPMGGCGRTIAAGTARSHSLAPTPPPPPHSAFTQRGIIRPHRNPQRFHTV